MDARGCPSAAAHRAKRGTIAMRRSLVLLCAATVLLGTCGGRRANPVGTVSLTDQHMSCAEIQATMIGNDQRMAALREEERRAKSGNVALGVVGALLFWPALFALDTTDTEQVEITAYQGRNTWLASLAAQRRCGSPGAIEVREPGDAPPAPAPLPAGAGGNVPPAAAGEFLRCQLDSGSGTMLTRREWATWGGPAI